MSQVKSPIVPELIDVEEREKILEKDWKRELTPKEIVRELDRYIIGQERAKKSVAIALRNRWRRQQVKGDLKE